jgi:hypothetical protein
VYAQTEPKGREWILKAARSDYAGVNKMAQEMPSLVKRKDINVGLSVKFQFLKSAIYFTRH